MTTLYDSSDPQPKVHLSTFSDVNSGEKVWTVIERGMPLCAHTDLTTALLVYGQRQAQEPTLPLLPRVWDGDQGAWR